MFIDTSAYIGHWPFRKLSLNTLNGLDSIAQKSDITHMFVANLHGVFYRNSMQANLELYEQLKEYKGVTKMLPVAIIDPTYPAWREDMTQCVKEFGFKAVELCPKYHGDFDEYALAKEGVLAADLAYELGVPVRVCFEYENFRQHHRLDTNTNFIKYPDFTKFINSTKATIILNGTMPHQYTPEFIDAVNSRENVFVDFSRASHLFGSGEWDIAYNGFGAKHICFGTLSPFYYTEPNLVFIHYVDIPAEEKESIAFKNIQQYV